MLSGLSDLLCIFIIFFKFLYRNDQLDNNITDGFNPIKLPKPQPDAIKRLEIDEVAKMSFRIHSLILKR